MKGQVNGRRTGTDGSEICQSNKAGSIFAALFSKMTYVHRLEGVGGFIHNDAMSKTGRTTRQRDGDTGHHRMHASMAHEDGELWAEELSSAIFCIAIDWRIQKALVPNTIMSLQCYSFRLKRLLQRISSRVHSPCSLPRTDWIDECAMHPS